MLFEIEESTLLAFPSKNGKSIAPKDELLYTSLTIYRILAISCLSCRISKPLLSYT